LHLEKLRDEIKSFFDKEYTMTFGLFPPPPLKPNFKNKRDQNTLYDAENGDQSDNVSEIGSVLGGDGEESKNGDEESKNGDEESKNGDEESKNGDEESKNGDDNGVRQHSLKFMPNKQRLYLFSYF
jgi:hypothetical protein